MNDELERVWPEEAAAQSLHYPEICLDALRKSMKTFPDIA
jgi:hypothetical protein